MLKILHIAPIGNQAEGIGTVLKRLSQKQIDLGNDVKIVSKYRNDIYEDFDFATITDPIRFENFIVSWTPDIAIFHSMYEMEYISFSKIIKKYNIPYLVQMHGALSKENYKKGFFKKRVANILWFNKFLREAKCLIYLNKAEYNNCVVNSINNNYAILPNGCDLKIRDVKTKAVNRIIDILYIGRININHKGLDVLIKAIQSLKNEDFLNVHFSFYGNENDPDVEEFKELIKPLNGYADFMGGIYGKEKELRLQECDMFILTSRYEGMPMGVLEALSYGVPCILTPGTNMVDVICSASAGWSADFNASSISDTIKRACNNYRTDAMSYRKNAFDISMYYSWDTIARETVAVYSQYCKQ